MTDPQIKGKEARFGAQTGEGIAFYAWAGPGVKDTVPVYRLTRMGDATQSFFTADKATADRLVAAGANDPAGWKRNDVAPEIAFYAYPPSYTAANQINPYDCSIQVNYVSERCAGARANLEEKINKGEVPTSNDCPKALDVYLKAPFPGQFAQDCQNFWNTYMKDCSIQENFLSDRCKVQRDALAAEQKRQAEERAKAAAAAKAASGNGKKTIKPGQDIVIPEESSTTPGAPKKTREQLCHEFGGNYRRDGSCTAPGGVTPGNTSSARQAAKAQADAKAKEQADATAAFIARLRPQGGGVGNGRGQCSALPIVLPCLQNSGIK